MTTDPPMTLETALTRAGHILDRYRNQPPTVLRVINCYDVEAIAVLAAAARRARQGGHQGEGPAGQLPCFTEEETHHDMR